MPVSTAGRAIAEKAEGYVGLAFIFERERSAGGHRDGSSHGADDRDDVQTHIAHVHVAVAATGESTYAAHVLGENIARVDATNQEQSQIAVRGKQCVLRTGM